MIKRLKRKYILIVMAAVSAVLGIIIAAINVASYSAVNSQLDDKLTLIIENEGKMPEFPVPENPSDDENEENTGTKPPDTDGEDKTGTGENKVIPEQAPGNDKHQNMSPETPFETRYFTVKLDTDGTVLLVDTSKIAAVNDDEARSYAEKIQQRKRDRGYVEFYRYMKGVTPDGELYVFLDANRELESVHSFLIASLSISAAGILMVFILVVLLSEAALKPIIESYEKQKRFITDAGHEMKTPLTVISANAEIIEMENGENEWVSGIKSQVAKLASLTEKLVILSKMEEGVKLDMDEFSLSDAVHDSCGQYKSIAMNRQISFELDIDENVLMMGNEGEIRRCISLLLDNAFRYANEGGTVGVRVRKSAGGVEMVFHNTTSGVEKGSLDRWFDRFYRTDLSRNSDTGGSGIGLSVVKAVVRAHGGFVHAHSEDGIKVEFTINI